jgi:hypothetical protein
MTTEQPTEPEDIDGFFLRGELDSTEGVLGRVSPVPDEDTDAPAPPSAAQLARRARLRWLVTAIVAPLGLVSAVLLGPRALSFRVQAGSRASSDVPHASAAGVLEPAAPARSLAAVRVVPAEPVAVANPAPVTGGPTTEAPKLAQPSVLAAKESPKTAPVAMRAGSRGQAQRQLERPSAPSGGARSAQMSVIPSQRAVRSDPLPTARFPTSARN